MLIRMRLSVLVVIVAGSVACSRAPVPSTGPLPPAPETQRLILWAEADPDEGVAPLSVQFACDLIEADIEGPRYFWQFGDGGTQIEAKNPVHVYKQPGEYTARCIVSDRQGRFGEDLVPVVVQEQEEGTEEGSKLLE